MKNILREIYKFGGIIYTIYIIFITKLSIIKISMIYEVLLYVSMVTNMYALKCLRRFNSVRGFKSIIFDGGKSKMLN